MVQESHQPEIPDGLSLSGSSWVFHGETLWRRQMKLGISISEYR